MGVKIKNSGGITKMNKLNNKKNKKKKKKASIKHQRKNGTARLVQPSKQARLQLILSEFDEEGEFMNN